MDEIQYLIDTHKLQMIQFEQHKVKAQVQHDQYLEKKRQEIIAFMEKELGEMWDILKPYITNPDEKLHEELDKGWLVYKFDMSDRQLAPFMLNSDGFQIQFTDGGQRTEAIIRSSWPRIFHSLREKYINNIKETELKKIKDQYRQDYADWRKTCEEIQDINRGILAETQKKAQPIEVFDLVYLSICHAAVLSRKPGKDGFWRVLDHGDIVKRKFFNLVSIDQEPILLFPGQSNLKFANLWGVIRTDYGNLYHGPGDAFKKVDWVEFTEPPDPPQGLSDGEIRAIQLDFENSY